jgi:hypothetical protein
MPDHAPSVDGSIPVLTPVARAGAVPSSTLTVATAGDGTGVVTSAARVGDITTFGIGNSANAFEIVAGSDRNLLSCQHP